MTVKYRESNINDTRNCQEREWCGELMALCDFVGGNFEKNQK